MSRPSFLAEKRSKYQTHCNKPASTLWRYKAFGTGLLIDWKSPRIVEGRLVGEFDSMWLDDGTHLGSLSTGGVVVFTLGFKLLTIKGASSTGQIVFSGEMGSAGEIA